MSLCHYGYQTYLSTQPISNMSLKNMALCHYGYQTYLSTQPISNMSLKNMYFCHSGLTLSILLCHSVLYSLSLYV